MADNKLAAIASRKDIFEIENDSRIFKTSIIAIIIGIVLGIWFATMEIVEVVSDYFENLPTEVSAKIVSLPKEEEKEEKKKKPKKKENKKDVMKKKMLKASKIRSKSTGRGVGKGDIKQRVTQKGLLAVISGKAKSGNVVGATVMSSNFAKDLDDVLANIGGLKTSGKSGVGRKGIAGGKFNQGYAGGGGAGGIDDLLAGLAGEAKSVSGLRKKSNIKLPNSKTFWNTQTGLAGRSPQDIYRVVMQHIGGLRHEYNKRLRSRPGLKGKITVVFKIAPSGRVLSCRVKNSTIRDPLLEGSVVRKVRTWRFDACGKCGIATVTYPFAFSQ